MVYIFIFGPQRTGSTLLHRLLGAHPRIDSTPNDLNFLDVYSSGIPDTPKWRQWGFDVYDVESLMKLSKYAFLEKIVKDYFKHTYNKYKLHKTCKGEFNLRAYQHVFGGHAKFIYILRNPLAIMASRKYWKQPDRENKWVDLTRKDLNVTDVCTSFKYIEQHLGLVFESIKIIDQVATNRNTLAVVNYEQLATRPRRVLEELFGKLRLNFKDLSLTDGSQRNLIDPYTSHKELEGRRGIYTNAIDIWKKKLTKFEIQLMYNEMVKFRERKFSSKLISSWFDLYVDIARNDLEGK